MTIEQTRRRGSLAWRIVKWFGLTVGAIFVICLVLCVIDIVRGPRIAEHVSASECPSGFLEDKIFVPPDATDVCYATRPTYSPNQNYEFTVSEESFMRWAKEHKYDLKEIEKKPYTILRYTFSISNTPYSERQVRIFNGLFYEICSMSGAGIRVAYDRDRRRAYWDMATR
jgi:hypothetical protein